ncbi:hypothetical protein RFI_16765 [Reticulomyxa filosa]|uniref:Uncharacterized protein n=1 Tax=Reticulomyxa filosa TaxID=46433 RepID=X6N567_RETFI|nr:hypothetical protein RFI_16765 [Reticulomyxa filosa]|eukprot:ETO20452.1 hypothetical protein RFI_16765 [Reticulomyxa filosa]
MYMYTYVYMQHKENSIGHCTIENSLYIQLDGLCSLFKLAFGDLHDVTGEGTHSLKHTSKIKLPEHILDTNESLLSAYDQIFQRVRKSGDGEWIEDTQLSTRYYDLLKYFAPLYRRKKDYLSQCYFYLLGQLKKKLPLNPSAPDSYDVRLNAISNKRKICHVMLSLAKELRKESVPLLADLQKEAVKIIEWMEQNICEPKALTTTTTVTATTTTKSSGIIYCEVYEITENPVAHLLEFLTCISNGLTNRSDRKNFFYRLLTQVIHTFESDKFKSIFNNPNVFAKKIQFPIREVYILNQIFDCFFLFCLPNSQKARRSYVNK